LDREDVRERLGNDRNLLERVASQFLGDYPQMLAALQEASVSGDAVKLTRAAHSLRGALANVGAIKASRAAVATEDAGRRGDLAGATSAVSNLQEETDRFRDALLEWKRTAYQ
jgi:HPt (histidine-containing phosphotransfer) domain-containing protein